jgi:hypothetical protein
VNLLQYDKSNSISWCFATEHINAIMRKHHSTHKLRQLYMHDSSKIYGLRTCRSRNCLELATLKFVVGPSIVLGFAVHHFDLSDGMQ